MLVDFLSSNKTKSLGKIRVIKEADGQPNGKEKSGLVYGFDPLVESFNLG